MKLSEWQARTEERLLAIEQELGIETPPVSGYASPTIDGPCYWVIDKKDEGSLRYFRCFRNAQPIWNVSANRAKRFYSIELAKRFIAESKLRKESGISVECIEDEED